MGLDAILTATMKSKITIRNITLFCMIMLVGTVSFVLWQNFKIATPEQLIEMLPDNVDIALDNVDYTETRGDRRFWRLQADSVAHEAQRQEAHLENVHMTLYDQGKFGDIQLTAQRGKWFSETGNVELNGDVVVKSGQGQVLYCQQLFYDNKAELITSESPVRLVAKDLEITGQRLQVYLPQQRMLILGLVQTKLSNW